MKKFKDAYMSGEIELDKIYDYIEKWHNSNSNETIFNFLGMTEFEYGCWMQCGDF